MTNRSTVKKKCNDCQRRHARPTPCVRCTQRHCPHRPGEANCAAREWANTDPAGAVRAICTAETLRALRAAEAAADGRLRDCVGAVELAVEALARGAALASPDDAVRLGSASGGEAFDLTAGAPVLVLNGMPELPPAGVVFAGRRLVDLLADTKVNTDGLSALALVHARQPRAVAPDVTRHPHAGILLAPLAGAAVRVQVSDRFDERLPELPGPGVAADGDGWLPGFEPGPGPLATIPILSVLHAGGLEAFQRGRGAPWPLRIAYETLIDVPAAARDGGITRLEYPLRGAGNATLQAMLYPSGRLNLARDWGSFMKALAVVDRITVPADGGRSDWLPIRVRSYPRRDGGVLRLDVSLPPGSDKGPRILRRVLRRLGARSYPQWRAWLALAYLWDRSAFNGHWVRATRPRLARDSGGRLVDATGAVILDKRGAPAAKWNDRRAVLLDADGRPVSTAGAAARERNPEARRHPWLTAAGIVALGYPPERGLSAPALSMRKARVMTDLGTFVAEGLAVVEMRPDGRRWRVLPPGTDPA